MASAGSNPAAVAAAAPKTYAAKADSSAVAAAAPEADSAAVAAAASETYTPEADSAAVAAATSETYTPEADAQAEHAAAPGSNQSLLATPPRSDAPAPDAPTNKGGGGCASRKATSFQAYSLLL